MDTAESWLIVSLEYILAQNLANTFVMPLGMAGNS
jgi:hypothetical protein